MTQQAEAAKITDSIEVKTFESFDEAYQKSPSTQGLFKGSHSDELNREKKFAKHARCFLVDENGFMYRVRTLEGVTDIKSITPGASVSDQKNKVAEWRRGALAFLDRQMKKEDVRKAQYMNRESLYAEGAELCSVR